MNAARAARRRSNGETISASAGNDDAGRNQVQNQRLQEHVVAERNGRHVAEATTQATDNLCDRMISPGYSRRPGRIERGPGGQPFGP